MRPLRCQHSALPLSYTPIPGVRAAYTPAVAWQAFRAGASELYWRLDRSAADLEQASTSAHEVLAGGTASTAAWPAAHSRSACSATAAKPVMNITRVCGAISAACWASSIPSISGMTMSDSSRSNLLDFEQRHGLGAAVDRVDLHSPRWSAPARDIRASHHRLRPAKCESCGSQSPGPSPRRFLSVASNW